MQWVFKETRHFLAFTWLSLRCTPASASVALFERLCPAEADRDEDVPDPVHSKMTIGEWKKNAPGHRKMFGNNTEAHEIIEYGIPPK